jgi:hypothetical protein
MSSANRLGELLVREKLISLQQLRRAQEEQKRSGQNLGYTLAKLGYISDGEITNFLSSQYRLPAINLDEYEIDAEVVKLVSREVWAATQLAESSNKENIVACAFIEFAPPQFIAICCECRRKTRRGKSSGDFRTSTAFPYGEFPCLSGKITDGVSGGSGERAL